MKKTRFSTECLAMTAMMTAMICIMTAFPKIPIPLGYAHLGDAFIVLAVLFVGKKEGIWASALGSALADFIGGFPAWILPTLIIKGIMALILSYFVYRKEQDGISIFSPKALLGIFASMIWMIFGYTIAGAMMYGGLAVGLTSTPGLSLKAALNILISLAVGTILEKAHVRHYVMGLKKNR